MFFSAEFLFQINSIIGLSLGIRCRTCPGAHGAWGDPSRTQDYTHCRARGAAKGATTAASFLVARIYSAEKFDFVVAQVT
jgi:hypothetical protein